MWSLSIFLLLQATTSKEHCGWKSALVRTTLLAWQINLVSLDWYESQTTVCAPLLLPQPLPKLREPSPRLKSQATMSSYPSGSSQRPSSPSLPHTGPSGCSPYAQQARPICAQMLLLATTSQVAQATQGHLLVGPGTNFHQQMLCAWPAPLPNSPGSRTAATCRCPGGRALLGNH